MIERTLYQFDLGTWTDELRSDGARLAELLRKLVPSADIEFQSIKMDLSILRIEIEVVHE